MSRNPRGDRTGLPIEERFPIDRVNEIAEKESRAKQHYRPVYTMHKWWARRPGSLFRAISLYSLLDEDTDASAVSVYEPGENQTPGASGLDEADLLRAVSDVGVEDSESLWEFYRKDVRIEDKKVLDPFMGGGTSLVEASRFGAETVGMDLNPVAWFVTKKELDAGQTDPEDVAAAFEQVREAVADEIRECYRTPCPHSDHEADVMYTFWVKELDCVSCERTVSLFKDYRVAKGRYGNSDKYNVCCPDCGAVSLTDDWHSETECADCGHEYVPENGNVSRGKYTCPHCGQEYGIADAIEERSGFDLRPYAIEYYCRHCDDEGRDRNAYKGYKSVSPADRERIDAAERAWEESAALREYVPDGEIPAGWYTASTQFSGSAPGAHDIFEHGYERWTDLYTPRQLRCLSALLRAIDDVDHEDAREYLLLAFSDALMFQNTFSIYNMPANKIEGIFRLNAFVPQTEIVENNVWGTRAGRGTFENSVDMVLSGIEYANSPTERSVGEDGDAQESAPFAQPIGENASISLGDMRSITDENEYDAVITDPPYYNNVLYSELADYFYVWLRLLLSDTYEAFDDDATPRDGSIVTNPAQDKTVEDFEREIGEAFDTIRTALVDDGVLVFTYHHSNEESWGELLASLCETGFEVTATYPINSDLNKFQEAREAASFDIVIVARPTDERQPVSWNSLRRRIVRTARETRAVLEENRELKGGDIGVIEMGKCFQEYSRHHGEVRRGQDAMTAKEVVREIYGIVQDNTRGEQAVYLDLLEEPDPGYDDLSRHLRHSDASEDRLEEMRLVVTAGDAFSLLDWRDEGRQAYVRDRVREGDATPLDRAHFLRYRFEEGKATAEYLDRWSDDDLSDVCEGLTTATGDETYLRMIGVDTALDEYLDR